jgi:4-hydroxy-tetrahydrodipicolinate synthase
MGNQSIPAFQGSITALVTPFTSSGALDEEAFRAFVSWQIDQGTHGLVPVGTTGESVSLTCDERKKLISWCVDESGGRVPVIAGVGSSNTQETLIRAQHAQDCGADAVLVVTPFYNKPMQEGLYQHYKTIAEGIRIPLFLYNIPGRAGVDLSVETVVRLSTIRGISGLKEGVGDVARVSQVRMRVSSPFILLSGNDATTLGFLAHGGQGAISVTSNIAPALCAQFHEACYQGRYSEARALHERLMPLHLGLFSETSPAPCKYALSLLGKMSETLRLPMIPVCDKTRLLIRDALVHAGLVDHP